MGVMSAVKAMTMRKAKVSTGPSICTKCNQIIDCLKLKFMFSLVSKQTANHLHCKQKGTTCYGVLLA